jgi:hypothetical protein
MALFIVSPDALRRLAEEGFDCPVPELTISDDRDGYSTSDGDGLWIMPFVEFIQDILERVFHLRSFQFSRDDEIDKQIISEIPQPYARAQIIAFINEHYEDWRDNDISLPDYDDVRSDCREWCDECDSGWEETHGEYDGPLAEDVEANEPLSPDLPDEERQARSQRNQDRQRERERRQRAQEAAEEEVVDREFICDDSCDSFLDHVDECYRNRFDSNVEALRQRWKEFTEQTNDKVFPRLIPRR